MDKKIGQGPPPPPHLDKIQKNSYFFSGDRPLDINIFIILLPEDRDRWTSRDTEAVPAEGASTNSTASSTSNSADHSSTTSSNKTTSSSNYSSNNTSNNNQTHHSTDKTYNETNNNSPDTSTTHDTTTTASYTSRSAQAEPEPTWW